MINHIIITLCYVNCRNEIKMKKMILAVMYLIKEIGIKPEKILRLWMGFALLE